MVALMVALIMVLIIVWIIIAMCNVCVIYYLNEGQAYRSLVGIEDINEVRRPFKVITRK